MCEHHMKKIREELGEDISPVELQERAISGEKNKYRDAWLKVNGDSLKDFAKNAREYLNQVNPSIRLGVCSCMSLWDNDGVDTETISRLLAGDTKPFVRLIGAPYWAPIKGWGNRLQNVIELERMERSWCSDDIEIFSEGDAYPRPRTNCPAAYMELFDMAMRADGTTDGILKYAIDYASTIDYECGYIDRHCRNKHIYEGIEKAFANKTACGVRVYEAMNKLENMEIPEEAENSTKIDDIFFSPAARMLADCSVPTVYRGEGVCSIAFGENIKYVPDTAMKNGIIIDMRAAQILEGMGIDTGIKKIGGKISVTQEYFCDYKEQVNIHHGAMVYETELKDGARILSSFVINQSKYTLREREIPAAYLYENDNGYKFLVFAFDAYFNSEHLYRSYARSRQLRDAIVWLSGKALPAYSYGNPDLYIMCKRNSDSMAVGLWNIFADSVIEPVVEVDDEYSEISFINCTGRIDGAKVILSEIQPFSFAGFELRK